MTQNKPILFYGTKDHYGCFSNFSRRHRALARTAKFGALKLGQAVATGAGNLPFGVIIHVAGLNWTWTASEMSIRLSTANALRLAREMKLNSLAFPLIGAGTGGIGEENALRWMRQEIERDDHNLQNIIVRRGARS